MSSSWSKRVVATGAILAALALMLPQRASAAPSVLDTVASVENLWTSAFTWLRTVWSLRPIPAPQGARAAAQPPKNAAGLSNDGRAAFKRIVHGQ
jgi:hypothetical protein